ncbi:hypothetical protein [endosymbiont of Ridgeia piscesae]|jgi:hypothetical protein|uniref:Uncharacterized protein n=1 Tax=endosymbiont of Ridgeia piscesae TaxID=54398 RepID=A0A0T5Z1B0_9GAMM|nr:hypothetical protein [endosymbiont of Ridgeia piscesae]KRT54255.1 hypothetical protein Ga0074115_10416 [endosymbiont of Ridgeia piscesae]KRT56695.1 hypothetical protein Ga0076813_10093 [endosymbiont of Ridgeia piscesae]
MFGLLKSTPPIDEPSAEWLFDAYAWALRNFDARVFHQESILVVPSNEHFPGRENSLHGMAELIFEQVKVYAGMAHWPCRLLDQQACMTLETPSLRLAGAIRGSRGIPLKAVAEDQKLIVLYQPNQVSNPEALIASFAHTLAHYLGTTAEEPPPGGPEQWPHLTELLAVFMGFGLMFANSVYAFKGSSCGSCGGGAPGRSAFLSEEETTYALAIFAVLKEIPAKDVSRHLKKSLRPVYKQALKDLAGRGEQLARLQNIDGDAVAALAQ